MGKRSLIKSTSKKKDGTKKKEDQTTTKTIGTKTVKKTAASRSPKSEISRKKRPTEAEPSVQKEGPTSRPKTLIDPQQKPSKAFHDIGKKTTTGHIPENEPDKTMSAGAPDSGEAGKKPSKAAEKKARPEKKISGTKTEHKPSENEKVSCYNIPLPDAPSFDAKGSDSMEKTLKYLAVGFAVVFLLIIGASISNMNKYYIKPTDGGMEIWKGKFSPMSKELLVQLPEVQPEDPIREFYSKKEIAPFAFEYYSRKADDLLNQPGATDLEEIKAYLRQAQSYSFTVDQRKAIDRRLAGIDFTILLFKADVAASRGTIADIETALGYLDEAALLDIDLNQTDLLIHKMDSLNQLKTEFESMQE